MIKFRNIKYKKYSSWVLIVTLLLIEFIILKSIFDFKSYTLDYILLGSFFILSIALNKEYRILMISNIKKIFC